MSQCEQCTCSWAEWSQCEWNGERWCVQEARELNIGGLMTATTYIARVQALDVTGAAGLSTSILFTTPLLQTSSNGTSISLLFIVIYFGKPWPTLTLYVSLAEGASPCSKTAWSLAFLKSNKIRASGFLPWLRRLFEGHQHCDTSAAWRRALQNDINIVRISSV